MRIDQFEQSVRSNKENQGCLSLEALVWKPITRPTSLYVGYYQTSFKLLNSIPLARMVSTFCLYHETLTGNFDLECKASC